MKKKLILMMFMLIGILVGIIYNNQVFAVSCSSCGSSDTLVLVSVSADSHVYRCNRCVLTSAEVHLFGSWSGHSRSCTICGYTDSHSPSWSYSQYSSTHHTSRCTTCGYSSQTTHSWSTSSSSAATCTSGGSTTQTCAYCNEQSTTTSSALGHNYRETSRTNATCTEAGTIYYTCTRDSSHTKTEAIAANGHTTPTSYEKTESEHYKLCSVCSTEISGTRGNHIDTTPTDGYCDICNYLMDITPPTLDVTPFYEADKTAKLNIVVTDDIIGVKSVTIQCNDEVAETIATAEGTYEYTLAKEGTYILIATDNSNNERVYTIDTYTISYSQNHGSMSAPASHIKIHGYDCVLQTYDGTRTGYDYQGWSLTADATSATWSNGGTYAEDASNLLYANWLDVVKPIISKVELTPNTWTNGTVKVRVTAEDNETGIELIEYSTNKSTTYSDWDTQNYAGGIAIKDWTEQTTLYFRAKDTQGNYGDWTEGYLIKIDKIPPRVGSIKATLRNETGSVYSYNTITDKSVYIKLDNLGSDEGGSELKSTTYTIEEVDPNDTNTVIRTVKAGEQNPVTLTKNGAYRIIVTTEDNAGNTASSSPYIIKIERKFTNTLRLNNLYDTGSGIKEIEITITKQGETEIQYQDTITTKEANLTKRIQLPDGTFNVTVTIKDNVGNEKKLTSTLTNVIW